MDRLEFLNILNKSLKKIPKEERKSAVEFYEEYFADSENEAEAVASLPHPKKIATKIIMEVGEKQNKLSMTTIVLAICSAPVTLPIALSLLCVVLALLITFVSLILVPYILIGSLLLGVIPLSIAVIPAFSFNFGTGLFFVGMTLCFFSLSILGLMEFNKLAKKVFGWLRKLLLKIGKRSYQDEENI